MSEAGCLDVKALTCEREEPFPWQSVAAVPLWIVAMVFVCGCGDMHEFSFLFTMSSAGLAWWGFEVGAPGWWRRVLVGGIVVMASMGLAQNIGDVLWFGCGAWF